MMRLFVFLTTLVLCQACNAEGDKTHPSDYVDYVVLGKSINHRQSVNGDLKLLNTVFFAEIFPIDLTSGQTTVTNGVLTGPGDAENGLSFSKERIPFLAGQREMTIEKLTKRYPDSTYNFSFDTPSGPIKDFPVSFSGGPNHKNNPGPIKINLHQDGRTADINAIDPNQDLKVTWSSFDKGSQDPNGIIDDMIYVILGNCMGDEIAHSGHAISDLHALTFDKTEFVIDSTILSSGEAYQLEVEHSNMETDIDRNIEIIVTYAATSFLDFKTEGYSDKNKECPAKPYAMDGGQTDRDRRSD